jgi:multiple sugar transport system permease protein
MTKSQNEKINAALFILPSFIGFFVFLFIPMLSTMILSFSNFKGAFRNLKFSLRNYEILFSSKEFSQILINTIVVVVASAVILNFLGFAFALMLNKKFPGRNLFRGINFLPVILSTIAISLSFMLILNPSRGPVNAFLNSIGIPSIPWLASPKTALSTIITVMIWQNFGYYMIIYLSGLQSVNPDLYEAAEIDGADAFQKMLNVTIPGISPVIFFNIIISVINAFKVFDFVYIMTGGQLGGGPGGSTNVIAFDIYIKAFTQFEWGRACAEAVILFVIVLTITIIQNIEQKRWVSYDII